MLMRSGRRMRKEEDEEADVHELTIRGYVAVPGRMFANREAQLQGSFIRARAELLRALRSGTGR